MRPTSATVTTAPWPIQVAGLDRDPYQLVDRRSLTTSPRGQLRMAIDVELARAASQHGVQLDPFREQVVGRVEATPDGLGHRHRVQERVEHAERAGRPRDLVDASSSANAEAWSRVIVHRVMPSRCRSSTISSGVAGSSKAADRARRIAGIAAR